MNPYLLLLSPGGGAVESRNCASVEICNVASGEADAMIHRGLNAWDITAGMVIAKEAGASISHLDGAHKDPFQAGIVVAAPKIHSSIIAITKPVLEREYEKRS